MNMEQLVERELAGETKILGENPPQIPYDLGSNRDCRGRKPAINPLSCGYGVHNFRNVAYYIHIEAVDSPRSLN
jgi:hypothetical protein